ncbi:MAG: two-CW domain-containing protein [Candidatus Methylomirabilia bacterium]
MKKNCWEFKKCGREPGGANESELGVCPAANEVRLDAVHGGRNAGRSCWVVAGTLCKGETQGTFAVKFGACEACEFYLAVREEEFPQFQFASLLLNKIKE